MIDTTARFETLKTERDRYVSLAFCWADLLFEIDRNFNIAFSAGATQAFFGKTAEMLEMTSFRDLVAPTDVPIVGQLLKQVMKTGRVHDETLRVVSVGGNLLWMSMSAYCLTDSSNLFIALRKSTPAAKATALSSPHADSGGLFDSGSFAELAADRLKRIQAAGESAEVTLLSIPAIEDLQKRLDPKSSSDLLYSVGEFLKANSVGGDSAAKVAEGRFSIMHAAGTNVEEVVRQIEGLTQRVDPTGTGAKVQSATMTMDTSIDVSEEDLAKGLLYTLNKFRDTDGEGVSISHLAANMSTLVGEAVAEVNNFKQVVAQCEFFVALQPIIHVNSGEIHHYEALCRFAKDAGASPFKTITFAEETGLIHDFDLAMAKKVIEWLSKFPRNNDKYRVAVNVSGFSIGKPSYVDALMQLLKENPWTQGRLLFEITESSRMSDLESANTFIQTLRKRGYHVCLDDFGAGAASFQYLSVLDVDVVKLDGSAVKNAQKAAKGRAFLSALSELCRRMNVETIAEMVDTPDTLDFVRDCGCNYVQGYLFGRPSREVKDFNPLPQSGLFKKLTNLRY
ncbi:MAG TPA: EAL domain-containing protein [Patescibacteria group bacterium]|nr:EAL domain-containing protein [Patescibacteria group bacterium]